MRTRQVWIVGKYGFFKKNFLVTLCFSVLILISGWATEVQSADKTYVLKGITSFERNNIANKPIPDFINMVEKESKGKLKIKWLGGPEVMPMFDQPEALRSGMIDMVLYLSTSYYKSILKPADAKGLSELTAPEERKTGAFALWKEVFRKDCNAKLLGFWGTSIQMQFFSIDRISSLDDFKGKTLRCMPLYTNFVKSLGASPVVMPPPEIYTALQRKVVDGFMWPCMGVTPFGWHELVNYILFPMVFRGEASVAVNLDKFQSLPKDLQDILTHSMEKMENVGNKMHLEIAEEEREIMKKKGVQEVHLSQEEAERFKQLSQDATWPEIFERSPEYGPKFKELSRRELLKSDS